MFNLFAHAGHEHTKESMDGAVMIDHCMPIILGAGLIILFLVGVIIYFLANWQPKSAATTEKPTKSPAKKKSD